MMLALATNARLWQARQTVAHVSQGQIAAVDQCLFSRISPFHVVTNLNGDIPFIFRLNDVFLDQ